MLTILNWNNSAYDPIAPKSGTDGTHDRLIFNQELTMAQLADISFGAGYTTSQVALDTGFYEVGGITAVPEPSTIFGAAALLGLVGCRERKRFAKVAGLLRKASA